MRFVIFNYATIRELVKVLFCKKLTDEQAIESWTHDMLAQSVLIRDEEGNYTPAHRSFFDFFVAYKIGIEFKILTPDFFELLVSYFPDFLETQREESETKESDIISVFSEFAPFIYSSTKEKCGDLVPLTSLIIQQEPDSTLDVISLPTLWIINPWLHHAVLDLLYLMVPFHEEAFRSYLLNIIEATKDRFRNNL